jgi:hypothetical protein
MLPPVGNYQRNRSVELGPLAEADLHIETDFGRAVKTIITGLANYANDVSAWGDVEYQVIVDGIPHIEYGSIYDQIGSQEKIRTIPYGFIEAASSVRLHVINHSAANTYSVGMVLEGDYVTNS